MAVMIARTRGSSAPAPLSSQPLAAEASEQWQGIYGNGKKIGYSHRLRTPTADGFTVETDAQMHLEMMGAPQLVRTNVRAETDRALVLRKFDFHLHSGAVEFEMSGRTDGKELVLESRSLGQKEVRLPMTSPIALSETIEDFIGREKLETGRTMRFSLFDPVTSTAAPVTLSVGPLERVVVPAGARSAFRVDEEFQGSHFRLWIEPNGTVVKEEGPLGLTLVREADARSATGGIDRGAGVDLGIAAAIPVNRAIPSPRNVAKLRLRVLDSPAGSSLSFAPRQQSSGDALVVVRDDPKRIRSYALPATDSRFAEDLRATPFFQADDEHVKRTAVEIVGKEKDAERVARRLVDWVYQRVEKVPTLSVPNALQVLQERKGDCNEHAVLFAALARAAGLPARMLAGVVYIPSENDAPGAFYYHAWNEVWLGEWIAVDPTFDQFPADATHVELVEGGPDKDITLLGLVGRLRLDVEEVG